MKGYGFLIVTLVWLVSNTTTAQLFLAISAKPTQTDTYFQKINYYGSHQGYFVVTTFLKDSTLYRIDNYQLLNQLQVHGSSPDTLNICVRQGLVQVFYPGGKPYLSGSYKEGTLNGPLLLFYRDGSFKRRELYRAGHLKRSNCYTPQGERCPCSPLYQPPQWNGNPENLRDYLIYTYWDG
jgi:hypothetical protein